MIKDNYHRIRNVLNANMMRRPNFLTIRIFNWFSSYMSKVVDYSDHCIQLRDSNDKTFYIVRGNRINLYRFSWSLRLDRLQLYYGTDKLSSENIKVIVDVGANIGEFGLYFLEREGNGQDTFCLFVEPDPIEFNVLSQNIHGKNALALNVGLWKENGSLTLYHDNQGGNSSIIEPPNFDYKSSITVKTLDTIIEDTPELQQGIDLIKIEAEGAEPEILLGSEKALNNVRFIVVDCGPERGLKQESTLVPVIEFMYEHGFSLINFIPGRYSLLFKRNAN